MRLSITQNPDTMSQKGCTQFTVVFTVAPEMKNPMAPAEGTTENTCFVLSEVYSNPAGLQDHWEQAQGNWEDFGALNTWLGKVDVGMVNGTEIVHSLW